MKIKKNMTVVFKLLNLLPNQEFEYHDIDDDTLYRSKIYIISEEGTIYRKNKETKRFDIENILTLQQLLNYPENITKIPWLPKVDEQYYSFFENAHDGSLYIDKASWYNSSSDLARYKAGWVFKTIETARLILPDVAKEFNLKF